MILFVIAILLMMLTGVLLVAVGIFRVSCQVCRLEKPPLLVAVGIVSISWIVLTITEAILLTSTHRVYDFLGYPYWETRLACTFVGLPLDMLIASFLHKIMMRETLGKAFEVWFVQRLILLTLILLGVGLYTFYYLLKHG